MISSDSDVWTGDEIVNPKMATHGRAESNVISYANILPSLSPAPVQCPRVQPGPIFMTWPIFTFESIQLMVFGLT